MWPTELNYWAILVCAVLYFVLGAVWYGFLFGKAWLALVGKTEQEIRASSTAVPYAIAGLTAIVCALMLAIVLRLSGADANVGRALAMALLLWVGFAIGTAAKHYAFPGRPPKLLLIDYGYDLVAFLLMALILAMWK